MWQQHFSDHHNIFSTTTVFLQSLSNFLNSYDTFPAIAQPFLPLQFCPNFAARLRFSAIVFRRYSCSLYLKTLPPPHKPPQIDFTAKFVYNICIRFSAAVLVEVGVRLGYDWATIGLWLTFLVIDFIGFAFLTYLPYPFYFTYLTYFTLLTSLTLPYLPY